MYVVRDYGIVKCRQVHSSRVKSMQNPEFYHVLLIRVKTFISRKSEFFSYIIIDGLLKFLFTGTFCMKVFGKILFFNFDHNTQI